ncbi:hypothetical protein IFM89_015515 [Coptis chinensis]|uniref:KIB1-4 beta-propeller domain-containing protein n=1 Tax=Coptis chinensis TaxID=261450 RepID=A0A835LB19_9MAGN|nr:hypothetical protein IFM89_015515 [Coptis chinensis]
MRFSPWLMLAKRENDNDESVRSFYSVSSKRTFQIQLPQLKGRRCWGTPYGWLLTFGLDLNIQLFNPLTGTQISLPAQPTFQHQYNCYVKPKRLRRICELDVTTPKATVLASPPEGIEDGNKFYLIEMFGDLHLVARELTGDEDEPVYDFHYDTTFFDVYKFDFTTRSWIEVNYLDDQALFVGTNAYFAISTSDYPELNGGSIYFTDDNFECY